MPRPKIHEERTMMVKRIIDLVKEHGRFLSNDIAELLGGIAKPLRYTSAPL
ncbi:DUF977 family protein [Enterobacter hormaechei]